MITKHTEESLKSFEKRIAKKYNDGEIHAPIHLRGGNERQLIEIFHRVRPQDWVVTTWCSHLEALLKGVPEEEVENAILDRKSITLCFKAQRVISSAIVGSTPSIANGLAMAAKLGDKDERVYCFIGDMGALTGQAQENIRYAHQLGLPVTFVVADNQLSVKTPTSDIWGLGPNGLSDILMQYPNVLYYRYKNEWPHSGTGVFVNLW